MATYKVPVEHSDGFSASQVIMTNADKLLVSTDTPTLAGLNLTNCAVLGANSAVFQPGIDSTTFFQVKNAAGSLIANFNTTNREMAIGDKFGDGYYQFVVTKVSASNCALFTSASGNTSLDINTDTEFGDAYLQFQVSGSGKATIGIDNDDNDKLKFDTTNLGATNRLVLDGSNIGFGEVSPETITEWTSSVPYLTIHNSTHEDTDGGRESRIIAKGEQSGEEETTLGYIEFSHDGAADDQKGKIGIYTNDGSDGDSPTLRMTIDSDGLVDAVGDFTAGTIQADNGADYDGLLSGITNITIVGGVITAVS